MQAALPHVDSFLAGNSLASLEELADTLGRVADDASDRAPRGRLPGEEEEGMDA
jgi:hypothetical protein